MKGSSISFGRLVSQTEAFYIPDIHLINRSVATSGLAKVAMHERHNISPYGWNVHEICRWPRYCVMPHLSAMGSMEIPVGQRCLLGLSTIILLHRRAIV